jgi:hypothetical protein
VKRVAAALTLAALSLSCVVYSQSPLRGELPIVLDPELAGAWRSIANGKPDLDEEPVVFQSHGDHYVVAGDEAGEVFEITTARLAGVRYFNFVQVGDESAVVIWRYEIRDDGLVMAAMDYEIAKRLVKAGVLRGIDLDDAKGADAPARSSMEARGLLLTSSEDLEAYLLEHGPSELFPGMELDLVREPMPRPR